MLRTCDRIFTGSLLFLIFFTPFAFGAVQTWAYTVMEVVIFALVIVWMTKRAILARQEHGAWGTEQRASKPAIRNPQFEILPLALPLALFSLLGLFQLVPLPPGVLRAISPQTFEVYTQILPGWPERVPYSDLASIEQRAGSEGLGMGDGGQTTDVGQSRVVRGEELGVRSDGLGTGDGGQTTVSGPQSPVPGQVPEITEPSTQNPTPNKQDLIPRTQHPTPNTQDTAPETGSMLLALRSLLPPTWLPLSLSPNLGRIDLLKFAAFAALFFLVWRYPFEKPFEDFGFRESNLGFFVLAPEQRFLRSVILSVLGTGLLVATLGFVDRFAWNGKILLFIAGYEGGQTLPTGVPRASGPFINPDHFANYLSLILPLTLSAALFRTFMVAKANEYGLKIFCAFTTFLLFTGILLSLSRGGWISALFGVVILTWLAPWQGAGSRGRSRRRRHERGSQSPSLQSPISSVSLKFSRVARLSLITTCILLIVSLFLAGDSGREQVDVRLEETFERDVGLAGRMTAWKDSLSMMRDFPLLGVGLGAWQDVFNHYESGPWSSQYFKKAHNDYVEILAETGVVGFTLLAWFFVSAGRRLIGGAKKLSTKNISVLAAVLAALGGMAIHSFIDFSLQIPANALLFTVLLAVGLRLAGSREQGARSSEQSEWSPVSGLPSGAAINLEQSAWSKEPKQKSDFSGQRSAFKLSRFPAYQPAIVVTIALVLIGCAVTQQEEPQRPQSIAEARERLLWRPVKASYHLSVIGRVGDEAPPEWLLREYRAAQWIQPTNPYIRDQIAEILMGMGEREQALNEMTLSVAHAPSLRMHEYLSKDSLPELSEEQQRAVEAGFKQAAAWNYPEAVTGLAEFYTGVERYADEAALYEQAALKESDQVKKTALLMKAGQAYLHAERAMTEVRDQRSEIEEPHPKPNTRYPKPKTPDAIPPRLTPHGASAERAFRAAIAADPTDPKPYQQLISAIYATQKGLDGARELVADGIKRGAPALPLYLSFAEAAHKVGNQDERDTALESAKAEVDKLIKSGESPHPLYIALADGARRAGDREQESAALLKALDRQPRSPETLMRLASIYSEKRNYDRATMYLNRVAGISPNSADLYYRIAQTEEARYHFAAAGRAYARALELAPENETYRQRYDEFKARVDRNRVTGDRGPETVSQR